MMKERDGDYVMAQGQTAAGEAVVCSAILSFMHESRKHYTILKYYTNQNPEAAVPGKRKLNVRSKWV